MVEWSNNVAALDTFVLELGEDATAAGHNTIGTDQLVEVELSQAAEILRRNLSQEVSQSLALRSKDDIVNLKSGLVLL